jgi:hypothetical protein
MNMLKIIFGSKEKQGCCDIQIVEVKEKQGCCDIQIVEAKDNRDAVDQATIESECCASTSNRVCC